MIIQVFESSVTVQALQETLTITPVEKVVSIVQVSGPQGLTGAIGLTGPQGEKGEKGDTGEPPPPAGEDKSLQFRDGDVVGGDDNLRWDKNSKSLIVGRPDLLTNNPIAVGGALDDFLQVNVHNTEEGEAASADYVCTNDQGDDFSHYIDMGINSSIYNQEDFSATKPHDGYLLVEGGDLVLGPITEDQELVLVAGGSQAENIVGHLNPDGLDLEDGKAFSVNGINILDNRPLVLMGTGTAPDPTSLPDGTLFIKYTT